MRRCGTLLLPKPQDRTVFYRAVWAVIVLLFVATSATGAEVKRIRLRSEIISTRRAEGAPVTRPQAAEPRAASGLFLIQFENHLQPAWSQTLRALGVELVRYVPDDAFVARFNNVPVGVVKALPFVHWVGEFSVDRKVHPRLQQRLQAKPGQELAAVSVLVSPTAAPGEVADAQRRLQGLVRVSRSRLGVVLRGTMPAAQVQALAESSAVLWVEPAPQIKLYDEVAAKIVAGDGGTHTLFTQFYGFDGAGVTVAVADSGLNNGDIASMHPDLAGRVVKLLFYGSLTDAADEHSHGTHVTGIIAGNGAVGETDENSALYGLGVAPQARIVAQRIFDGLGNFEFTDPFETLTRDAVRAGADIGSNSWGDDTQGSYDLTAAEFDALVRDADALAPGDQSYILEFSAGNAGPGPQTIGQSGRGQERHCHGRFEQRSRRVFIYADGPDAMADFSSRGPCEDGRIKPDLVAPGTWIASLKSASATDENAWAAISDAYMYQGGTSQAGPQVSGAAAVLVQYLRDLYGLAKPSPALVKAALINSATDMDDEVETGPAPNMDEGWGRVDLTEIILSSRSYELVDQTQLLITGQTYERRVIVAGTDEPLKITLTYTDVPGFPGAIPALVNDLDLEVEGPDGTVYRGNQFDQGESAPNAPSPDTINNVEGVRVGAPAPGEYIVRVRASHVAEDARNDTAAVDQDFALVISADIAPPGQGLVALDRPAYTAPGLIRLKVVDTDLAGQSSVTVQLRSTRQNRRGRRLRYGAPWCRRCSLVAWPR